MVDLYRTRAVWTGFPGGPGISTFYGLVSGALVPNLHQLFVDLYTELPNDVSVQVQEFGDVIDDATGALTGAWSTTPVLPCTFNGGVPYTAPAGFLAHWLTTTILDGHRLRGSTFFVPGGGSIYDTDGSISATHLTAIKAACATFFAAASGDLAVWHRPRAAAPATAYHPAVTARAGGHGIVTGYSVPDKSVVLRSRRD